MRAALPILLLLCHQARAGWIELGATGNYRTSTVDEFNYSVTQSDTGSVAYYFIDMSAIELSYTQGQSRTFGRSKDLVTGITTDYVTTVDFTSIGADLIVTLSGKSAPVRPYIKVGAAKLIYKQTFESRGSSPTSTEAEGVSPSAGIGLKIMMGEHFAIKSGVDVSKSPTTEKYDFIANAGLSIIF